MIGIFLIWYWASFGHQKQINVFIRWIDLILEYSNSVTTFAVSAIVSHGHKLDMVHIQNATLAGGVAVGSVCNLLIGPHGALLIGVMSGVISVLGYRYMTVSFMISDIHFVWSRERIYALSFGIQTEIGFDEIMDL